MFEFRMSQVKLIGLKRRINAERACINETLAVKTGCESVKNARRTIYPS